MMTTIIQIPIIHNSEGYPWLTIFQIARFYRVIIAIPNMRRLLARLSGSVSGLLNMMGFLLLINLLTALVALQFLRGDIPFTLQGQAVEMSFYQTWNSFIGIFQILTSENWTNILYPALGAEAGNFQVVVTAFLLCGWFMFGYFILLQMFIAVINEGWMIAEEQKHKEQLRTFVNQSAPEAEKNTWLSRLNPYRHVKARPKVLAVGSIPSNLVLPMRKIVVRDVFLEKSIENDPAPGPQRSNSARNILRKALRMEKSRDSLPMEDLTNRRMSNATNRTIDEGADLDRQLDLLNMAPGSGQDTIDAAHERRAQEADFITAHPSYDRSLWIFSQRNYLRKVCQRCVEPSSERIFGVAPIRSYTITFRIIIFVTIVGSITIAAVATPVFRLHYFINHGDTRWSWFTLTEVGLGLIFILEFLIKIIADGFIFSPNAYFKSIWNALDFFVLLTLIVNIVTSLVAGPGVNRFTRALKAFRALRLINLSDRMRETFYIVFVAGASHIFDASLLAILYIIPFAVWGLNIFAGLLYSCNDGNASNKNQCVGEYLSSPLQWTFLAPRAWQNPYVWSFDSFRSALLILFEIISLEGWVNVMQSAMWIVGINQQPQQDAAQYNAVFFIIYMLIGESVYPGVKLFAHIDEFCDRCSRCINALLVRHYPELHGK